MWKVRIIALAILLAGLGIGYFTYSSEINPDSRFPFKLGLDLAGGTHLVYRADISELPPQDVASSMESLRDVIERRTNLFGVSEPIVQVERGGLLSGASGDERLIVELPGVTDISEAIRIIGNTPVLEFKLLTDDESLLKELEEDANGGAAFVSGEVFISTGLTGRFLKRSALEFGGGQGGLNVTNEPIVRLDFTKEGADLFAEITRENVGRVLAIFLDNDLKSAPVIQDEITGGSAVITGNFTPDEARTLVRNLNLGALPVPIELLSTQTIGASLGKDAFESGIRAGIFGIILVALFLVIWYRLPGVLAAVSLFIYIILMLALFKLVPVTLTAAGIAGFILSIGLAVDANILIFERMKEELAEGNSTRDAIRYGFSRAWLSIRDGNISSFITAIILFWFGTSLVKGFALTFGIGILVSMLTAITISRTFLLATGNYQRRGIARYLFGSGVK